MNRLYGFEATLVTMYVIAPKVFVVSSILNCIFESAVFYNGTLRSAQIHKVFGAVIDCKVT